MNFRNIDIDAIENEFYNDQDLAEVDDRNPEETTAHFNSLQSHSTSLLNSHQTSQALALLLDSPPFGPTQNSAKSINTNSIIQILSSTRTNDIEGALKDLQPHHHDNLMKYIYKSMSLPIADSSGNVFLSWHEKLTQVAGTGNQCFQYVGLPPRDDLDSTPDIKIGLDHCRNLGSSDISLFYKDEEISVSNDDRCESLSGNDEGGFRCILEA
ncbi:hypothetical protein E3P78_01020 [Wallemia ichthyophaga]|nr:hypothetical protein E3P78_01020 [Wallemia ichthyophaga]